MTLPSGLAGMYGELLAFQEIDSRFNEKGYKATYYSGHKGADIELTKDRISIKIEVKTSRLKEEGFGYWYGFALHIKKCKKPKHLRRTFNHRKRGQLTGDFCYFDYAVCVKLSRNFRPKFYVFEREYLWKHRRLLRNRHARFTNSSHRIILSNNNKMPRLSSTQLHLIKEMEKHRNRWSLVS